MKVFVDASKTVKKLHNFWNHIHFHPTDAIEDDWGREILDKVAEDKVAQTVRMYAMLEDIVSLDENGNLCYDFTLNDQRIDYMVSKGFNLLISYNFMPPCISSDPEEVATVCKNATRYKGKFIITAPPRDYKLWEEVCYTYTKHIVERYGLETVSSWYLQCFNEPDITWFFMKKEKDMSKRCEAYFKLYDAFESATRRVSDKLKIGGPALASKVDFLNAFLKHIKDDNKKLDYICFHAYGTTPANMTQGIKPFNVHNLIDKMLRVIEVCKINGFDNTPLIIDEWGASSIGFLNIDDFPALIFRENEVYSAFYARLIMLCISLDLPIDKMLICLSGQHEMTTEFAGFRGFFTMSGLKKPIYNAYALAAKLGEYKLATLHELEDNKLHALATSFEDGHLAIMLVYAGDDFRDTLPEVEVELSISGAQNARTYKRWIIDADHANAYGAYKKMGAPSEITPEQMAQLSKECNNVCEDGEFSEHMTFTMKCNAVTLIEIF